MNRIGIALIACALVLFFASTSAANNDNDLLAEVQLDQYAEKFQKNGHKIFCYSNEYAQCFNITQDKCIQELQPHSDKCVEYSKKKNPEGKSADEKVANFIKLYSACMMLKHVSLYPDQEPATLRKCIGKVSFNNATTRKAIEE